MASESQDLSVFFAISAWSIAKPPISLIACEITSPFPAKPRER